MKHNLSEDQILAMRTFTDWYMHRGSTKTEFMLGGLAGTGKTSLIREIRDVVSKTTPLGLYSVITPTAKASAVLRSKGILSDTSHSLLCNYIGESEMANGRKRMHFKDKWVHQNVIICDEASMVTAEMRQKIRRGGDRLIWVGDYGQLAPVRQPEDVGPDDPGIMCEELLDAKLTTQHRHGDALEIIKFAEYLRNGGMPWCYRADGAQVTIDRVGINTEYDLCAWALAMKVYPIITHTNKKLDRLNEIIRHIQCGDQYKQLYRGLKLKCITNNKRYQVWNGDMFEVAEVQEEVREGTFIKTTEGRRFCVKFDDEYDYKVVNVVDGYAVTCHNAQGSEWDRIAVVEDLPGGCRWRYTAATRAQKAIDYFLKFR